MDRTPLSEKRDTYKKNIRKKKKKTLSKYTFASYEEGGIVLQQATRRVW